MLVSERSPFEVLNWQPDSSGRIISVLFKLDELRFNLVNIYAPTNPTQRKGFYDTSHEFFYAIPLKLLLGILTVMKVLSINLGVMPRPQRI